MNRSRLASHALAALAFALLGSTPVRADGPAVDVGLNQAWLPGGFGTDLTSTFDEAKWREAIKRTHDAGGSILRVWLFEGQPGQGIQWDAGDPHKPTGVDPKLVENVRTVCKLAAEEHVRLYWTAQDGNWPNYWDKKKTVDVERMWNVDSDKYGFGKEWDEKVLGPVVDAIAERKDALYGLDLLNEAEGMVENHAWADGWTGARAYLSRQAKFVHARAPGTKVSASAGWGTAAGDILAGHFDGLGLDFLDVHVYTDSGKIPDGKKLAEHARKQGLSIIVGEAGQSSKDVDPKLQAKVLRELLEDAASHGFSAVLAWQLTDEEKRFAFYDGDQPRPAIQVLRDFARAHAPPAPSPAPEKAPPAVTPAPSDAAKDSAPSLGSTPGLVGALGGVTGEDDRP